MLIYIYLQGLGQKFYFYLRMRDNSQLICTSYFDFVDKPVYFMA